MKHFPDLLVVTLPTVDLRHAAEWIYYRSQPLQRCSTTQRRCVSPFPCNGLIDPRPPNTRITEKSITGSPTNNTSKKNTQNKNLRRQFGRLSGYVTYHHSWRNSLQRWTFLIGPWVYHSHESTITSISIKTQGHRNIPSALSFSFQHHLDVLPFPKGNKKKRKALFQLISVANILWFVFSCFFPGGMLGCGLKLLFDF